MYLIGYVKQPILILFLFDGGCNKHNFSSIEEAERFLDKRLPTLYKELLHYQNGGVLRFPNVDCDGLSQLMYIMYGISKKSSYSLLENPREIKFILSEHCQYYDLSPEEFTEEQLTLINMVKNMIIIGGENHVYFVLNYTDCDEEGEPSVYRYQDESAEMTKVAQNFKVFIEGLYQESYDQYVFEFNESSYVQIIQSLNIGLGTDIHTPDTANAVYYNFPEWTYVNTDPEYQYMKQTSIVLHPNDYFGYTRYPLGAACS